MRVSAASILDLRPVKQDIYAVKGISPQGEKRLCFFGESEIDKFRNNIKDCKLTGHDQFHVFGILVKAYPVFPRVDAEAIANLQVFEQVSSLLFTNANLEFVIGDRIYFSNPVSRILDGQVPGDIQIQDGQKTQVVCQPKHGGYFGFDILMHGKRNICHVPHQQTMQINVEWEKPIPYDENLLGRVFLMVGLVGLWHQEIG